jgi:regulator of protease activity HflC (stomatin/prohibitin superfamily)
MFDKLIDLIVTFGKLLRPWCIITPCFRGVICRCGKEVRQISNDDGFLGTGFHWMIPLGIEKVYDMSLATRLAELASQALVTRDGKCIVAGITVTYRVQNVSKAIFSVWNAFSAAQDACQANFAQAVLANDYDVLRTEEFADDLTKKCRKLGFTYGFEIDKVRICELAPARTLRLVGSGELTGQD